MSLKVARPSEGEAHELSRLFPRTTAKKRTLFDPRQSLGLPDKKKKKKALTSLGRSVKVTVCRLPSLCKSVPKGTARRILKCDGRIVDVQVTRAMPATMMKEIINRAFSRFNADWQFVEVGRDNLLTVSQEQSPDGQQVCSKRGCLYIVDEQVFRNMAPYTYAWLSVAYCLFCGSGNSITA